MKKMVAAALAACMALGLVACGGAQGDAKVTTAAADGAAAAAGDTEKKTGSEMTWKMATDASKDYPTTKALIKFADEVYEKSGGRIAIDVYESSILGDEVSYMEQLQAGTVDVAKLSLGTLSGLYEDTQVFLLPFLFKNNTEMWKVLEGEVGTMVKDGGATIVEPDDATLDTFRAAMDPVYAEYTEKYGEYMNAINAALGK